MLGFWLADKLSSKVGNKSKKVEDMKLPGFLSIFKENLVSTSILMLVLLWNDYAHYWKRKYAGN